MIHIPPSDVGELKPGDHVTLWTLRRGFMGKIDQVRSWLTGKPRYRFPRTFYVIDPEAIHDLVDMK